MFVSSTLEELSDERQAVARAISALRLTPVMFEAGARPHPPRELYKAYMAQSDVFIGVYWQRYGHVGPGMDVSGLQEELHLSAEMPRLLYVKEPAPDREPRLAELLDTIGAETSYSRFRTPAELGRLVRDDLAQLLSDRFAAARDGTAPAPRHLDRTSRPPVAPTPLIGREHAVEEVAALVERSEVPLLTVTGPSGVGKTRLALAVADRVADRFDAGVVVVPLEAVTQPDLVLTTVGRAMGVELSDPGAALEALVDRVDGWRWLLVLDNLEHVLGAARDLDELLARSPGVTILATSLTPLRLRAEREYPLPPLPVPVQSALTTPDELAGSPAVSLFVERARAVRPGFALTAGNAAAVGEICRRLEGLPLAIELAAARLRLLDPGALLDRLTRSLDALGTGMVDLPERQRTLRATVEWSIRMLDDDERSLLERMAVFVGGWTVEAAAEVAGLDEDRALDLTDSLTRHSLIQLDLTEHGPRARMLDTIEAFVGERLDAQTDVGEVRRRHAEYFRALAEEASRPLRSLGPRAWAGRLEVEALNLSAAVRWYLAHDPAPLPHLFRVLAPFRVLSPFWGVRDEIMAEGRSWVAQLLPGIEALDGQGQAELLWTAMVTALEVGDRESAVAARDQIEPLLADLRDPYLRAVSYVVMGWTDASMGDLDSGLLAEARSLEELRDQDEPLWTALALLSLGSMETPLGRLDDAAQHLVEVRELAARFDNAWLAAMARVQLAALVSAKGRAHEARTLLHEGLGLGLAGGSTHIVAACLAGFAQEALTHGELERAALLVGAADGLRRRAGLRVWNALRGDAALAAQIREGLGAERFNAAFDAGVRLDDEAAVAAAGDAI